MVKKSEKEKFFNLRRKKIFLKSELDAHKQLSSEELKLTKPLKKLSEFNKFEKILKKFSDEKTDLKQVEEYIELNIEKYLVMKLNKNLSLVKPKNMKKKVENLIKIIDKFSPELKNLIESKLQEALTFILFRKFSTVYFGKTFKIFTEIPEKHLTHTLKSQIKAYNCTMKFLTLMKEEKSEIKILVKSEKIQLIHSRFSFLFKTLSELGISLNNIEDFLPNCLDKSEILEIEIENSRRILEHGFRILYCLITKILLLNYSYWIMKLNFWLEGKIAGDDEIEKEIYAVEACVEFVRDLIGVHRFEGYRVAEEAFEGFIETLSSVLLMKRLLEEGRNKELFYAKFFGVVE